MSIKLDETQCLPSVDESSSTEIEEFASDKSSSKRVGSQRGFGSSDDPDQGRTALVDVGQKGAALGKAYVGGPTGWFQWKTVTSQAPIFEPRAYYWLPTDFVVIFNGLTG